MELVKQHLYFNVREKRLPLYKRVFSPFDVWLDCGRNPMELNWIIIESFGELKSDLVGENIFYIFLLLHFAKYFLTYAYGIVN